MQWAVSSEAAQDHQWLDLPVRWMHFYCRVLLLLLLPLLC